MLDDQRLAHLSATLKVSTLEKLWLTGATALLSPVMEKEMVLCVNEIRGEGVPVSANMLSIRAIETAERAGVEGFQATSRWQHPFSRTLPSFNSIARVNGSAHQHNSGLWLLGLLASMDQFGVRQLGMLIKHIFVLTVYLCEGSESCDVCNS